MRKLSLTRRTAPLINASAPYNTRSVSFYAFYQQVLLIRLLCMDFVLNLAQSI
ncbi:hypothetical protein RP20_CCG015472 [Aedes albopictus]|nr:hypothetical protein RP20_CCG015472 [Aedes albopictus]